MIKIRLWLLKWLIRGTGYHLRRMPSKKPKSTVGNDLWEADKLKSN